MGFKEKYLRMKDDGLSDRQIAEIMGCGKDKITRLKRINGVSYPVKTTRNRTGLSQKEINIALSHGLTSKLVLQRVREGGWSVQDAINTPKGVRRDWDAPLSEDQEKQIEEYINRKRKEVRRCKKNGR